MGIFWIKYNLYINGKRYSITCGSYWNGWNGILILYGCKRSIWFYMLKNWKSYGWIKSWLSKICYKNFFNRNVYCHFYKYFNWKVFKRILYVIFWYWAWDDISLFKDLWYLYYFFYLSWLFLNYIRIYFKSCRWIKLCNESLYWSVLCYWCLV
jgi:hypothetical protein